MKIVASELSEKLRLLSSCLAKQEDGGAFFFKKGMIETFNGLSFGRAKINSDIQGLIPAGLLISTLSALKSGEVTLTIKESMLNITSGKFSSDIALSAEKTSAYDEIGKALERSADVEALPDSDTMALCNSLLASQQFASETYNNIFMLAGKSSICTDGYRMFQFKCKVSKNFELPSEAVGLITSMKEAPKKMGVAKDFIRLSYDNIDYVIVRHAVKQEEFDRLIDNTKAVTSAKIMGQLKMPERVIEIIDRIQVVGSKVLNKACRLTYSKNKLTIRAETDSAHAEDSITIVSAKPLEFDVLVNYEHFASLLQSGIDGSVTVAKLNDKNMVLSLQDSGRAFYISAFVG